MSFVRTMFYTELADVKSALSTINDYQSSIRNCYDILIDYFSEFEIFVNMYSQQSCMAESYGTVILFDRLEIALADFDEEELGIISHVMKTVKFSPVPPLIGYHIDYNLK